MRYQDLRIVFLGTPEFAVGSLKKLHEAKCNIVGVVTAADKPAGRGQQIQISAVKQYALANKLNLLQPEKLKDPGFLQELKKLDADLQIVVAFRMLPEAVWDMPAMGTINLHASLLPQYRGAAPINWAIINGETETGVSTFKLKHQIDTGDLLLQTKVKIDENCNAGTLHDILMKEGADVLLETVKGIAANSIEAKQQNESESGKHAPKLFKENTNLRADMSVKQAYNLVRGLSPYPAAHSHLISDQGQQYGIKIFNSFQSFENHSLAPGRIIADKKSIKLALKDGFLCMSEVQLAGKKRMQTEELLRGFKMEGEWKIS